MHYIRLRREQVLKFDFQSSDQRIQLKVLTLHQKVNKAKNRT